MLEVSCTQIKALQMTTSAMASLWTNLNVMTSVCLLYACYASGQYCLLSGSDDIRNCPIFNCNPPPELPTFPDCLNITKCPPCVNGKPNRLPDESCNCTCDPGFSNPSGDGKICTDINECSASLPQHDCVNAQCINTVGSFTCMCNTGFSNPSGDGKTCIANDQTNNTAVIAVVSVVGTAFTIVLIACGVRMWRKKRTPKNNRPKRTIVEMEVTMPEDVIALTVYEDIGLPSWALRWEIKWKNLVVEDTVLGQGNFGEVRSGTVNIDGKITKTAIKVLKGHTSKTDREDFMEEFRTMTNIGYHPNVVSLLGACPHEDDLYVALEYLPKGDLRSYLRRDRLQSDSDEGALSSTQLIKFALDIAKGMKHLAMSGVIHRDLAARNILLDERLVAKVSGFGLSRGQDIYVQTSMRRVPTRWLAIESLIDHTYTTQSDVWSFGILLWEIASIGGTPYPSIASKSLTDELKDGYRMSKPPNCDDKIYSLMLRCWEEHPSHRPTFSDLVRILSEMDDNKTEHTYLIIDRSGCENFSVIRPELDDN
ncbi:angiopoietin-1 receptor-like isoform X2 [Acanthaster planci]|uniref:Angiopoietin-1 receptor-like isoform X2 n=1 Tax=Acanthaster planci TaxID=133434 RepID=A0A8B7YUZ1_ACAPL|nr:angiopoietin-1 receptor-like isoform X2 [Acanthaster planci]